MCIGPPFLKQRGELGRRVVLGIADDAPDILHLRAGHSVAQNHVGDDGARAADGVLRSDHALVRPVNDEDVVPQLVGEAPVDAVELAGDCLPGDPLALRREGGVGKGHLRHGLEQQIFFPQGGDGLVRPGERQIVLERLDRIQRNPPEAGNPLVGSLQPAVVREPLGGEALVLENRLGNRVGRAECGEVLAALGEGVACPVDEIDTLHGGEGPVPANQPADDDGIGVVIAGDDVVAAACLLGVFVDFVENFPDFGGICVFYEDNTELIRRKLRMGLKIAQHRRRFCSGGDAHQAANGDFQA